MRVFLWSEKMPLPTAAELTDPNATNAQMKQCLGQLAENVAPIQKVDLKQDIISPDNTTLIDFSAYLQVGNLNAATGLLENSQHTNRRSIVDFPVVQGRHYLIQNTADITSSLRLAYFNSAQQLVGSVNFIPAGQMSNMVLQPPEDATTVNITLKSGATDALAFDGSLVHIYSSDSADLFISKINSFEIRDEYAQAQILKIKDQFDAQQNSSLEKIAEITDEHGFNVAELTEIGWNTSAQPIEKDDEHLEIYVDEHGFQISKQTQIYKEDVSGKWETAHEDDYIITDEVGFILFSAKASAQTQPVINSKRDQIITSGNSTALAVSSATRNKYLTSIARTVYDYNIVVVYGQSLSTGTEGWPALTKSAVDPNLLMFGNSTQPNTTRDNGGQVWNPVGGAELKELKSSVHTLDNTTILTDAQVAALAAGSMNEGESVEHGAVNFWRTLQNGLFGVSTNPSRKIIVLNCGVQGRTIQQLSKGASLNHFNRIVEAVTKVKAHILSINPAATIGHVATLFLQGEYNYALTPEGETKESYKNLQKQLRLDIHSDVTASILGQSIPAAFITYQTNSGYTRDELGLHVGMAQLEISNETEGCWLASPNYHITDKGGHLDSNGYRWLGMYFGKVLHQVIDRGIDWKPLQPHKAVVYEDEVFVHFLVPSPPLQFKESYAQLAATTYTNKGFRVEVGGVTAQITSVSIVDSATVAIKLAVKPTGPVSVWYADKTNNSGSGNLCDSDSTVSTFNYEYIDGSGQYAAANITALVDKPYPLNNYCTAFKIQANATSEE